MEIFFFAHRRTVYTSKWKILRNCKTKDMFLLVTSNKDPITLDQANFLLYLKNIIVKHTSLECSLLYEEVCLNLYRMVGMFDKTDCASLAGQVYVFLYKVLRSSKNIPHIINIDSEPLHC